LDPQACSADDFFDAAFASLYPTAADPAVASLRAGTHIRTPRGNVAIDDLRAGDRIVTASGFERPVCWVGRRFSTDAVVSVSAVLIKRGAVADGVPAADLWVSPLQGLFIAGALIAAAELVNGVSVIHVMAAPPAQYFHLELDSHDLLLAEGIPTESFIDDGSRAHFYNPAQGRAERPRQNAAPVRRCAPRVSSGPIFDEARNQIAGRIAAWDVDGMTLGPLQGVIETCTTDGVSGWVQDTLNPSLPVRLAVMLDGAVIAEILARNWRPDLVKAGIGNGYHGFAFHPRRPIPQEKLATVTVIRAADGAAIPPAQPLS